MSNLSYQEIFQILEEKIKTLSKGELGLAASFSTYEESLVLLQNCQDRLEELELTVQQQSNNSGISNSQNQLDRDSNSQQIETLLGELEQQILDFEETEGLEEAISQYSQSLSLIQNLQLQLAKYEQEVISLSKLNPDSRSK